MYLMHDAFEGLLVAVPDYAALVIVVTESDQKRTYC